MRVATRMLRLGPHTGLGCQTSSFCTSHGSTCFLHAPSLSAALRKGALPQLKSLYIHSNRIGDSGFKALTAALKPTAGETTPCHAIRELDVRNNLATDVGRRALKAVAAVRGFGCDMDRDNNDDAASHESEEF